ncbi:MAG: class I SAM-dependent methyltransferase [Candidatus Hodarchaeales archaeon]
MIIIKLEAIQKRYDRYSRFYDRIEDRMERMVFKNLREQVIGSLEDSILEVGVGTGKNLPYYKSGTRVTGIDISKGMLLKAKKKLTSFRGESIELQVMNAEELTFKNGTFDVVVCTFVLCSVPDPIRATSEILRVLKPDGMFILLEHVLSKIPLLAVGQKLLNPITRGIFGYNIDRNTVTNLEIANTRSIKEQDLTRTDVVKLIVCRKHSI